MKSVFIFGCLIVAIAAQGERGAQRSGGSSVSGAAAAAYPGMQSLGAAFGRQGGFGRQGSRSGQSSAFNPMWLLFQDGGGNMGRALMMANMFGGGGSSGLGSLFGMGRGGGRGRGIMGSPMGLIMASGQMGKNYSLSHTHAFL